MISLFKPHCNTRLGRKGRTRFKNLKSLSYSIFNFYLPEARSVLTFDKRPAVLLVFALILAVIAR